MDVFLAGVPLASLRVVVAGEGEAADAKARLFAGSPVELVRVAGVEAGRPERYAGARLAFVAGVEDAAGAAAAARTAGAWVNVVDRPELCDFTTPALIDRGAVVGAVATGGAAPLLAAELRREWEARWPLGLGRVAELIAALQPELRAALPEVAERRAWLRRLLDGEAPRLALAGRADEALALAREGFGETERCGRLSLLIPPSSPDLLSLRALQALGRADRLVVAESVDPELVALGRRDAAVERAQDTSVEAVLAHVARGEAVVLAGARSAFEPYGDVDALPVAAGA